MRSRLCATWTSLPLSLALLAGCGTVDAVPEEATRTPQPTPWATKTEPARTFVARAGGRRFVPGRSTRPTADLQPVPWRTVAYRDGRLTLGGLQDFGAGRMCTKVDQVAIGPPERGVRRVSLWADYGNGRCDGGPERIVIETGPDWDARTVATPGELVDADPRMTRTRRRTDAYDAVLQADRRTLVVRFEHGCDRLASARATLDGRRITVALVTGYAPEHSNTCASGAHTGHTLVRLPEPAPPGATVTR